METNSHALVEHIPQLYGSFKCMPASVKVFIGHDVLKNTVSSETAV